MSETNKGLSKEQVDVVLQFANGLRNYYKSGLFTPFSQNANLLHLNNAPVKATFDDLVDALGRSLTDAENIQGYSEFMAVFDTIYSKTINYYKSMLAFDLTWSCSNAKPSDYKTEAYKKDVRRLRKFLDNFDYKREFTEKVIPALVNTGIYFGWFRDSQGTINDTPLSDDDEITVKRTSKYSLQTMPQKYCRLTGYWNGGLLYDFDMNYFLDSTVDIQLFDPSFMRKFRETFIDNSSGVNYKPHAQFNKRNGEYSDWVQTNPDEGAVVFKFDEGNFNIIPPFASLMKPTFNNTAIHKLQMDKDMASAWAVLYGNIGLMDKEKSGQKPNQTAFSPEVMGKFMSLVQNSLQSIMKTVALPLEDTHFGQFTDSNADMESNALATSAGQGAYGSSLIYNTNTTNQSIVLNSIIADYNIMRKLYPQFASMLGFYANKKTKKFKFEFEFDGSNFPFEREYRRKAINELAAIGITLPSQYWASAYGYKPQMFQRALEEAHNGEFMDNITMLANINQTNGADVNSSSQSESGRPKNDDSQLTDSGSTSRDYS